MQDIIDHLLNAPSSQLDAGMKPFIVRWDNPPTALQVLEVLDNCIMGSLASGFVVTCLQVLYDRACKRTGTTHEDVIKSASWRTEKLNG